MAPGGSDLVFGFFGQPSDAGHDGSIALSYSMRSRLGILAHETAGQSIAKKKPKTKSSMSPQVKPRKPRVSLSFVPLFAAARTTIIPSRPPLHRGAAAEATHG